MWSNASPRCLAAATAISSRSLTFLWPVKSEKREGRNVSSNTTSGLFNVEIGRSAIARENARTPNRRQGERGIGLVKQDAFKKMSEQGRGRLVPEKPRSTHKTRGR